MKLPSFYPNNPALLKQITGKYSQRIVALELTNLAAVLPFGEEDEGLDFSCELLTDRSIEFCIQVKGSKNPIYSNKHIRSLPVKCRTIENYWLRKQKPVFIMMVDEGKKKIFFLIVTNQIYRDRKKKRSQKTVTFNIPLTNNLEKKACDFIASILQKKPCTFHSLIIEIEGLIRSLPEATNNSQKIKIESALKNTYSKIIGLIQLTKEVDNFYKNPRDTQCQKNLLNKLAAIKKELPGVIRKKKKELFDKKLNRQNDLAGKEIGKYFDKKNADIYKKFEALLYMLRPYNLNNEAIRSKLRTLLNISEDDEKELVRILKTYGILTQVGDTIWIENDEFGRIIFGEVFFGDTPLISFNSVEGIFNENK